jgi:hypothetical protein
VSANSATPARTEWIDLRRDPHPDVLDRIEAAFSLRLDRAAIIHGNYGVTEGSRTDRDTWVRIQRRPRGRINDQAWIGAEASSTVAGVPRPDWYRATVWIDTDRDVVWRADEMQLITSPVIGRARASAGLSASWWSELRGALSRLSEHQTHRAGMRHEHLTKRIHDVFPDVDTTVDDWCTAHADLHWDNVTIDGHLLDWEDWGRAPRGLDAAYLWGASLEDPELAAHVVDVFASDLQSRSGMLVRLLFCANVIRIAKRNGRETPLRAIAERSASQLLAQLGHA